MHWDQAYPKGNIKRVPKHIPFIPKEKEIATSL